MSETNTNQIPEENTGVKKSATKKSTAKKTAKKEKRLVLPRYLRLAKGGMWRDVEGEYASGATVYAIDRVMVGRSEKNTEIQIDKFNNQNLREYGYIDKELPWYIDLKEIPKEKLSRIIIAYKSGILVRANPEEKPSFEKEPKVSSDWKLKQDGALIFDGKNKQMFKKLQNLNFTKIKEFILECPLNESGRDNLLDLLDYEKRGFNPLSRPRLEVLALLRQRLREFGPGMTGIRTNEDNES